MVVDGMQASLIVQMNETYYNGKNDMMVGFTDEKVGLKYCAFTGLLIKDERSWHRRHFKVGRFTRQRWAGPLWKETSTWWETSMEEVQMFPCVKSGF